VRPISAAVVRNLTPAPAKPIQPNNAQQPQRAPPLNRPATVVTTIPNRPANPVPAPTGTTRKIQLVRREFTFTLTHIFIHCILIVVDQTHITTSA
jgi:hypothetical protein